MEQWKPVDNASAYYVSDLGRVKGYMGKPINGWDNGLGYRKVGIIYDDGSKKKEYIHRLVAMAFIPNPNNKPCINHKDNDPTNNKASNLEWCTHQENTDWMKLQGRNKRTAEWIERIRESQEKKPVIGTDINTGVEMKFDSVNSTKAFGFEPSCVSNCCNGIRKSHAGYTWRFQ